MSGSCCHTAHESGATGKRYRRVLWGALGVNGAMFLVEVIAGLSAGSVSLQADALDFLADTATYGITLFILGKGLRHRALAGLMKGLAMGTFGIWVLGNAVWHAFSGAVPESFTMGAVGFAALVANGLTAALLLSYRSGDSNMRSVWLCSRNDAIGNLAVMLAALGVFGTGAGWPDVIVACIMGGLALQSARLIVRQASGELGALRIPAAITDRQ
ncbi:MAG TPA: cation transporter [Bryobacteraceae bacterium]|jgi:Co/Zn/Cd efflux system component|nr:cation transporter [Bryobacteraceae bacterium]